MLSAQSWFESSTAYAANAYADADILQGLHAHLGCVLQ
jgi:hypothetical protein